MLNKKDIIEKLIQVDDITMKLNDANKIICMSEIIKDSCIKVGLEEKKITVLGNRVNTDIFMPKSNIEYNENIIKVLFIGRLQKQKNLHGIIEALNILKEKKWRVFINIVGKNFNDKYLESCVNKLNADEYKYWGTLENNKLNELFNNSDMYVGPSFFEGFQIPLIESLASGTPCIVSNQQPATEIINEEAGRYVDPEDSANIADKIEELKLFLNNKENRNSISSKCRKLAEDKWTYEKISQNEADIYLNLINENDFSKKQK